MKIALMGTAGAVPGLERFGIAERLTIVGQNTGNLVFQYAAARMIAAESVVIGHAGANWKDPILAERQAAALVFPAANHLRTGRDWTGMNNLFDSVQVPIVVIGLGVQAEHVGNPRLLAEELRGSPSVLRMVDILREKAAFVGVRGPLTAAVCEELGLRGVEALGCPSLTISPEPALGQRIRARFAALRERLAAADAGPPPRLVVTAAAPWEVQGEKREVERRLATLLRPGDLYVQQSGGVNALGLAQDGPEAVTPHILTSVRNVLRPGMDLDEFAEWCRSFLRVFYSVDDWMQATAEAELFIGTRLHGNVIGVQQGLPAALIAHDARTSELIGQMCLPSLALGRFMAAGSLAEALAAVEFDADAFDAERARVAAVYRDRLGAIGLGVRPHLHQLAAGAALA